MNDDDKRYFSVLIENSVNKAISPVMERLEANNLEIQSHGQTLNGVDGIGGLVRKCASIDKKLNRFLVIGGILQGFGVGFGMWLRSIWK